MATRYDLRIDQGASYVLELQMADESGNALDMTGCTAASQIRQSHTSAAYSAIFTCAVDVPNALITLTLTGAQTAAISHRKGVWDVELTYQDGTIQRLLEGQVTINPEATK